MSAPYSKDMLAELDENPYPLLAELRRTEPAAFVPELNAWLVTRYDLAITVLRDSGTFTVDDPRFTTARVTGPSMLSLDGTEHVRHRGAFGQGLRPGAVDRAFVQARTRHLTEAIRPAGEAELRRAVAGPLAAEMMSHLLGLDQPAETILAWYDEIVATVAGLEGSTGSGRHESPSFRKIEENVVRAVRG